MKKSKIDINFRDKNYTAVFSLNKLPVNDKQMSSLLAFCDYVKKRKDVAVVIRINDEHYEDEVPQEVLLTESAEGFYMELNYSMVDWGWDHPLLLANDHLTEEEAATVLISIFHACTDNVQIVTRGFGKVSSSVYPDK